jgi:hypothetical protein
VFNAKNKKAEDQSAIGECKRFFGTSQLIVHRLKSLWFGLLHHVINRRYRKALMW